MPLTDQEKNLLLKQARSLGMSRLSFENIFANIFKPKDIKAKTSWAGHYDRPRKD